MEDIAARSRAMVISAAMLSSRLTMTLKSTGSRPEPWLWLW